MANRSRLPAVLQKPRILGLLRTLRCENLMPALFGTPLAFARRLQCNAAHG